MSHIVQAVSEVESLDLLEAAAVRLGLVVERNVMPRYYGSAFGGGESKTCEVVIRLPGKYDLGAKVQTDGSIAWLCDNELLHGEFGKRDAGRQLLGDHAEILMRAYGEVKVEDELMRAGVTFTRFVDAATGDVRYEIDESQLARAAEAFQVQG